MNGAIAIKDLAFAYSGNKLVLDVADFQIKAGERVFLHGPSGSGKTTLLGLIGGILTPSRGSIHILGTNTSALSPTKRDMFRGTHVGFIFQMFNLIPYLSVLENIVLPVSFNKGREAKLNGASPVTVAAALAERLGISNILTRTVTDLSVGQQQRVAAARAMIGKPEIVIADEPTSALDTDHRQAFIQLLFDACRDAGTTLLFVSHDHGLASLFDRQLSLPSLNRVSA